MAKKEKFSISFWMEKALLEGKKARGVSEPNPWVGAILVHNNQVIGKGHTQISGKSHAEVMAIQNAIKKGFEALLPSSTLYVTLEPCAHYGKTPPCVEAIFKAGIKKVVIGIQDPDEKVAGRGIQYLKEHGIEVIENILTEEITENFLPYLHHRKYKKPWIITKVALSLDGKMAAKDFSSQWISSPECASLTHLLRRNSQGILVGVHTILQDNPSLSVREGFKSKNLLKVILDPSLKTPSSAKIFENNASVLLVCKEEPSKEKASSYSPSTSFFSLKDFSDLEPLLLFLGNLGCLQLLVEGGGKTLSHFFEKGLVDEAYFYFSPLLLGKEGISFTDTLSISSLDKALFFKTVSVEKKGFSSVFVVRRGEPS